MTSASTVLPAPLRWAVRLLAAEAVAVGLVAVLLTYQAVATETTSPRGVLAVIGYAVVMAAALAGLAVALSRRKARARAPAIVLQLLAVVPAAFLVASGALGWLSVPVALLALLIIALLLAPATTSTLA